MAASKKSAFELDRGAAKRDQDFLQAMASDVAGSKQTQARAKLILALAKSGDLRSAAA